MAKAKEEVKEKKPAKATKSKVQAEESTEAAEAALKTKKAETKAAKKAGPKAKRAKDDAEIADEHPAEEKTKKKVQQQPRKSRLERRGKNYRKVHETVDKNKEYTLEEAVELLPQTSFVKFDPSVEVHIKLGVDPKQADENVRATVALPYSSGKTQRVAVFTGADKQKEAKAAGADVVGEADLLEEIKKSNFDFDILVATPDVMAQLGKYAKELGPKGLMPNPKSGTVTNDLAKTIKELKGGRIEFRVDPSGIVHQSVGKLSLGSKLKDNLQVFFKAVVQAKPASLKGTYVEKAYISTSMGPSIRVTLKDAE